MLLASVNPVMKSSYESAKWTHLLSKLRVLLLSIVKVCWAFLIQFSNQKSVFIANAIVIVKSNGYFTIGKKEEKVQKT